MDKVGSEITILPPPQAWMTFRDISKQTGANYHYVFSTAKKIAREHPEWIILCRNGVKLVNYCHPELATLITKRFEKYRKGVEEGRPLEKWLNIRQVAERFGILPRIVVKQLKRIGTYSQGRRYVDERFGKKPMIYFPPEVFNAIYDIPPIDWFKVLEMTKKLKVSKVWLYKEIRRLGLTHEGKQYQDPKTEKRHTVYYPPYVMEVLRGHIKTNQDATREWITIEEASKRLNMEETHAVVLLEETLRDNPGFGGTFVNRGAGEVKYRRYYDPKLVLLAAKKIEKPVEHSRKLDKARIA